MRMWDEEMTETPTEDPKMTNPEILKIKMIAALLEAIEDDDEDDAKQAIKQIRALLGADKEVK
jgi:hypothetical protein